MFTQSTPVYLHYTHRRFAQSLPSPRPSVETSPRWTSYTTGPLKLPFFFFDPYGTASEPLISRPVLFPPFFSYTIRHRSAPPMSFAFGFLGRLQPFFGSSKSSSSLIPFFLPRLRIPRAAYLSSDGDFSPTSFFFSRLPRRCRG